jgi:solute carrier family 45 protein 1/2/4
MVMVACYAATTLITAIAKRTATTTAEDEGPEPLVTFVALVVLSLLGVSLAVTFSGSFSMRVTFTEEVGGGQGVSMGALNLSISLPQLIVSLGAGPLDEVFGGDNMPAFLFGAGAAFCGGVAAVLLLPIPPPPDPRTFSRLLLSHSSPIP